VIAHQCLRCGRQWRSSGIPERCPGCKNHSYDLPLGDNNGYQSMDCEKCGVGFQSYLTDNALYPHRCPRCRDHAHIIGWRQAQVAKVADAHD
jgi:predicted Zn-ribbon and HTH transcriptional regulator